MATFLVEEIMTIDRLPNVLEVLIIRTDGTWNILYSEELFDIMRGLG
jgi:hypothetical protein